MLYITSLLQIIWKILKRILTTTSMIISKTKKNNYRERMKMRMAPAYTGAIFMKAIKRRRFAIVHGMDSNKF